MLDTIEIDDGVVLALRARCADAMASTKYVSVLDQGLVCDTAVVGGSGAPADPYSVTVHIANRRSGPWRGVVHAELTFRCDEPRFFLPAFMYGRNRGEAPQGVRTEFPRLRRERVERPSSSWWMVRSDRLSHPAALMHDRSRVVGLSAAPYLVHIDGVTRQMSPSDPAEAFHQFAGFTCSLDRSSVGYTLGYENAPLMFVNSAIVHERAPLGENVIELAPGEDLRFSVQVYNYHSDGALGVNRTLEQVYWRYHQAPRAGSAPEVTVRDLASAVDEHAWLPEQRAYAGFVFEEESGGHRVNELLSISWTNGLVVATPMLLASLRLGEASMRARALACIDNIVENSRNPASGLPYDSYAGGRWRVDGWWFEGMNARGHSGYVIGQALYLVLKALQYERELAGTAHEAWEAFVGQALRVVEAATNGDGEYPFVLSESTGAALEFDSMGGAWCLAAGAYHRWLTNDRRGLDALLRSEAHYHRAYIERMECYGGPLDTDKAVDSEGVVAYIKAVRYLHALTADPALLEHMRDAMEYEFSFRFAYNTPVQVPPLSRIGWSSCGGSVTSTANPHVHPMGSTLIGEMSYYLAQKDDNYVRRRFEDAVAWGNQTYNRYDREFDHGQKGWMSERFCHSEGLLKQTYPDGSLASTWFCLMPWASGCILDGLVGDFWDIAGVAAGVTRSNDEAPFGVASGPGIRL
jgi:hypothetical protein